MSCHHAPQAAPAALYSSYELPATEEVFNEAGDLIGVPANTRHWFDMSESPHFIAIRLFTNVEGWVAKFTGEEIASKFPRYERRTEPTA